MSRAKRTVNSICPFCKGEVGLSLRGNRFKGTEYTITKRGLKQWFHTSCYLEECKRRKALRSANTAR